LLVLVVVLAFVLDCCLSLLAAIAGAFAIAPNAKITAKAKSQNLFKRIPKHLPKLSTYGMIINFLEQGGFIRPKPVLPFTKTTLAITPYSAIVATVLA
jgi:hypothetical protein